MSYTEIYGFDKNGYSQYIDHVKNSHRSAMAIWSYMEDNYLPPYIPKHLKNKGITNPIQCEKFLGYKPSRCVTLENEPTQEIWDLVDNLDIPTHERICLYTTFDWCLVKKENIPKVIDAFKRFKGETSLKEQADILQEIYENNNYIAVGWNQTSVNGNNWDCRNYDKENKMEMPYNCLTQDDHFWLFDELKER